MALNSAPVGDAIASFIQSVKPAAGSPVSTDQLKIIWEGIVKIIYDDLKLNLSVKPGAMHIVSDYTSNPLPVIGDSGPAE